MHYTQITATALRLGILQSESKTIEVAMSSLLSEDIRTNPHSPFIRKRRGVYGIAAVPAKVSLNSIHKDSTIGRFIEQLRTRAGLADESSVLRKALYLAGRTLDIAGLKNGSTYRSSDGNRVIDIQMPDLVKEFGVSEQEQEVWWGDRVNLDTTRKSKQLAERLRVKDTQTAIRLSLFLLDLALDLAGQDGIIAIASRHSSTKVAVRSVSQNG